MERMSQRNEPMHKRLSSMSNDERASFISDRIARASREQLEPQLMELGRVLEELSDWVNLVPVIKSMLRLELTGAQRAEWMTRLAWCHFYLDNPNLAWEILSNAREDVEGSGSRSTKQRAYLVSGYVMDVRGAHAAALAWYAKALAIAAADDMPHVLLEIATSQSKQGLLTEANTTFEEMASLLVPNDPKHDRLRVHWLSRSAVVLELLGDLDEAVRRHTLAVEAAAVVESQTLQFECLRRRARSFLAVGEFVRAKEDLDKAAPLAGGRRRGPLHLAHDFARYELAQDHWQAALKRYKECIRMLPDSRTTVCAHSDLWSEILDGLDTCTSATKACDISLVWQAQSDLAATRQRSDIYSGQPLRIEELRKRAVLSSNELRRALMSEASNSFISGGFCFDVDAGTAHRLAPPCDLVQIDKVVSEVVRFLWKHKHRRANGDEIFRHLKSTLRYDCSPSALRKRINRCLAQLGLGHRQLVVGLRGVKGGGYELVVDA